jgi:hypothetical protein
LWLEQRENSRVQREVQNVVYLSKLRGKGGLEIECGRDDSIARRFTTTGWCHIDDLLSFRLLSFLRLLFVILPIAPVTTTVTTIIIIIIIARHAHGGWFCLGDHKLTAPDALITVYIGPIDLQRNLCGCECVNKKNRGGEQESRSERAIERESERARERESERARERESERARDLQGCSAKR